MKDRLLVVLIDSVKIKYLKCSDIEFKKYIGKILAGDIDIKRNGLIEDSKTKGWRDE
ncbi:hypothetical protein [Clostridium fermenticellae]|uniref:hypothetical protein n=1 Tax=Clostridium fermenticellae TaxID=2068654 RepID=UPI0013C46C1F|nr:hypothetical protein [Clostridium fermenticellae]